MDELQNLQNAAAVPMEEPKKPKKYLFLIAAVVVAAAVVFSGYWYLRSTNQAPAGQANKNLEVIKAASGTAVAGFPSELLLEKNAVIKDSYSVNYTDTKVSQPVVSYTSALTLARNIAMFKQYLLSANWQILHEADLGRAVSYFSAQKGSESLNITFVTDIKTGAVTVNMAYAKL